MRKLLTLSICFFTLGLCAQSSGIKKEFDKEIDNYISYTVPTITIDELKQKDFSRIFLLDAREKEEYNVSTIPQSIHIGYDDFSIKSIAHLPKNGEIVIFCSIGYRSEKIGEKLMKAGFTNIRNLYGSIFAWANAGNKLCTPAGEDTNRLHTFNRKWSKWVENPKVEKVW